MPAPALTEAKLGRVRQALNVAFAVGQPLTTFLCFSLGTSFEEATRSDAGEPPIVPAGYAFVIWGLIYAGCVAYAVYQASPARRQDPLLRRIGFFTASAFLGTCAWLVMARLGLIWMTVVCIAWMLVSLAGAFAAFVRPPAPLRRAERALVVFPVSVFAGWVTVATFANASAALRASGSSNAGLSEQTWTVLMLLAAGLVASGVTWVSRGNPGYALTIIWALVGIVVANVMRVPNATIAAVAAGMTALVAVAFLAARAARRDGGGPRSFTP